MSIIYTDYWNIQWKSPIDRIEEIDGETYYFCNGVVYSLSNINGEGSRYSIV